MNERNLGGVDWSQISISLPKDFGDQQRHFAHAYFVAQKRLERGQRTKAAKIFVGLDKNIAYSEFEAQHRDVLAAIDMAVKGNSRWDIEPAFTVGKIEN